jgi:dehydrogenase/reductase SDR family member 7B
MYKSLKNKVVFITGASSGIGYSTCIALSKHKVKLAFASRRKNILKKLEKKLEVKTDTCLLNFCITDHKSTEKAVKKVIKKWGRIDILINNAGILSKGHFHKNTINDLDYIMKVNYLGPAALTKYVLMEMLKKKSGHIVNVSSIGGLIGFPFIAGYTASKFALTGFTESLRREYLKSGISFSTFSPGTVDTPMIADSMKRKGFKKITQHMSPDRAANYIISNCILKKKKEVIVGEIPSFFSKFLKFFPNIIDILIYHLYRIYHPIAKKEYIALKQKK